MGAFPLVADVAPGELVGPDQNKGPVLTFTAPIGVLSRDGVFGTTVITPQQPMHNPASTQEASEFVKRFLATADKYDKHRS